MPDDKRNLYQRLHAAIQEVGPVKKDTEIGFGRSSYKATTYDNVLSNIKPALIRHGIVIEARTEVAEHSSYEYVGQGGEVKTGWKCDVVAEVAFVNIDDPKDRFSCTAPGTGMDSQDKAPGKAFTYAVKYALRQALMATTGENEEERPDHEASRPAPRPEKRPQQQGGSKFATEPQTKLINIKGKNVFGDAWEAKKAETLGHYGVTSTKELTIDQASKIIDRLVKLEEEKSLNEMGV
jgi:hypothetical protein